MNFPFTQKNEDGYIVRTFAHDVESEEEKKAMEAELKGCDAFKEMEKMTN